MIVVRLSCGRLTACVGASERSKIVQLGRPSWTKAGLRFCFTDGFLCVAVCLRGTALLELMLVLYRSVARTVDAAQRL